VTVNPWVVFAIASAAVFLVSVDATIAVAAFPALRSSFADTSPAKLSWVLNGYTILYAALLVPAGRLVDLHGAKRLLLFGVALFTLASAACGMAPGTNTLISGGNRTWLGGSTRDLAQPGSRSAPLVVGQTGWVLRGRSSKVAEMTVRK
jgi:MFS family permease